MLILNPVVRSENFWNLVHKYYDNYGSAMSLVHKNNFIATIEFLKYLSCCMFNQLSDLAPVDWLSFKPSFTQRFSIHYIFLSIKYSLRISFMYFYNEKEHLPTLTKLFFSSNWFEREAWDMFGSIFKYHNDLRRILSNYGFDGFPLLKSFPLSGIYEYYYSEIKKLIQQKKVSFSQNFRIFYLENPWIKKVVHFFKKNLLYIFINSENFFLEKKLNISIFLFCIVFFGFSLGLYDNIIFSILSLVLCFLVSSVLFLFLGLELIPLIIIILYIGSLLLVFLLSILILNLKHNVFLSTLIKNEDHVLFFIFVLKLILIWKFLFSNGRNNFFFSTDLKNKYFELDYITNIYVNDFFFYFFLIGFLLLITSVGLTSLTKFDKFLFFDKSKNLMFMLNKLETNPEYIRSNTHLNKSDDGREWDSEDFESMNQHFLTLRIMFNYDKDCTFDNTASFVSLKHLHRIHWDNKWGDYFLDRWDIVRSGSWEQLPLVESDVLIDHHTPRVI